MNASDEWQDPEADEPETVDDNDLRSEDTAADDSQDFEDTAEVGPGDVPFGLDEREAESLANLFSGTTSAEGVADLALPDLADLIEPASPADTLPLLDAGGNLPADFDALYLALRQWEAAAADVPGDPRFTPKPTTKPRGDLLMLDRGPFKPVVWLDRATMTPVKYAGQKPISLRDELSPIDGPPDAQAGDQDLNQGMSRPVLVVHVHRAGQHFENAFEARGERWLRMISDIAQERAEYERWWQACEERAINGDY